MCYHDGNFVFAWMTLCTFYILVYTSDCGEATCDELWFFMWLSLLPPALLWCCQYVKGAKQILIAVCVVEFSGLHSNVLVCILQFYSVNFTVLFCKCVYSFSVFLTKLFWQPQLPKWLNYRFVLVYTRVRYKLIGYTSLWQEAESHTWFTIFLQTSVRSCFLISSH